VIDRSPVVPPPGPEGLAPALSRNIDALEKRETEHQARATLQERLAQSVTSFTGSMASVYLHFAFFGAWILINLGHTPIEPWDSSLVVLAMIASVEAIFLSTFVLISQNRMAELSDRRAKLDLQTNLLAEHEITKLISMTAAIAHKLNVKTPADDELHQLECDVAPEHVLDEIDRRQDASS
jgi:uncharacterized membrane protein